MSRIGNKVIHIPAGVSVDVAAGNQVTVKGPKGQLESKFNDLLTIKVEGADVTVSRPNDEQFMRKIHGTTRALLANMVTGVSTGFVKKLEIRGVGYRAALAGKELSLSVGYSHPVKLIVPEGLTVELPRNTEINVSGIDKQLVGEFAANIRKFRKPEPYKGKGIRYVDEYVARKAGKTAK